MTGGLDRALPGPMIDLIRDGVPARDLADRGGRAVWSALCSTALSAVQRGWPYEEWAGEVSSPRSTLGQQARLREARQPLTTTKYEQKLRKAYDGAAAYLLVSPARMTSADAMAEVGEVAEVVDQSGHLLSEPPRAVLTFAVEVAGTFGTTRPAVPRWAVVMATGLSERTARTAMAELHEAGLLVCEQAGRFGARGVQPRAALYRLPTAAALVAYLYPEDGSVGRPAQVCGTPPANTERDTGLGLWDAPAADPPNPASEEQPTMNAAQHYAMPANAEALRDILGAVHPDLLDRALELLRGGADQAEAVGDLLHLDRRRRKARP